jgi:hypothetical protein
MTHERRYDKEEVRRIFEAAAAPQAPGQQEPSSANGLSLPELQAIGREVGVEPARIAEAADSLDVRRGALPRGTSLRMPISVGLSVDLPRAPTQHEWGLLLGELRQTFLAEGKDRSHGETRRWTNGNLYAVTEPTESGCRLRLGTRKSDATSYNLVGVSFLLMGLVTLVGLLASGRSDDVLIALLFSALGAAFFAYNAIRLPKWAVDREEQMEYIAGRARELIQPVAQPEVSREADR